MCLYSCFIYLFWEASDTVAFLWFRSHCMSLQVHWISYHFFFYFLFLLYKCVGWNGNPSDLIKVSSDLNTEPSGVSWAVTCNWWQHHNYIFTPVGGRVYKETSISVMGYLQSFKEVSSQRYFTIHMCSNMFLSV